LNIALITARGGSKGLPRKNILPLRGLSLIGWSIKAALDSNTIDRVFVSTEDQEIAGVSLKLGAQIIPRPIALAQDTSGSEEVIEHAIKYLETIGLNIDTLVLLQPTSPLRTSVHIDEATNLYKKKKANCVISVFEPTNTPIKAYVEKKNGSISGLYTSSAPYTRRQDLPRAFQPNGAIYIFSSSEFKKKNQIPRDDVFPYIMSEFESADIDTLDDLMLVEQILKRKK
jgi:CMP-N,N'-diacetyllegionaminic acid synthase